MSGTRGYRMGLIAWTTLLLEAVAWGVMLSLWWLLMREVPSFRFERPWALWAMTAMPVMTLLYLFDMARRNSTLARFADKPVRQRMLPGISTELALARFLTWRHGMGLVIVALAGPQTSGRVEEVRTEGIDVVVAIDVSNSMACEDLRPSRMEVARRSVTRLIDRMQGDRLGMVVFAGEAYVQLPITIDRSAAKLFLHSVGTHTVAAQGTAIGAAIDLAQRSFDPESAAARSIIVVSDGEDHEDDALGAARRAAAEGIVIHTVGMGTPQGGPIPIRRNDKTTGFRKDRQGNTVVTRLNEDMLRRIAAEGNGTYLRANEAGTAITQLVDELKGMDRTEFEGSYRFTAHEDRYQWPLGLGILLIVLSIALPERLPSRFDPPAIAA
ncbi:MAG: VWA domain-containing protein [Flavobacteriales bacterium]|nr:VWA domain-containing protein [Flavobacteriales bacterium]